MYTDQEISVEGLGAAQAIIGAVFQGLGLKNLLGIGVKKKKFAALAASGKGAWTSQYPPDWDWANYPAGHKPPVAQGYAKERAKKDSILLKNQIATPEDFAAWHFTEYGSKYAQTDPNWLPVRFDGTRIDKAPAVAASTNVRTPSLNLTPAGDAYSFAPALAPASFAPESGASGTAATGNIGGMSQQTLLMAAGVGLLALALSRKKR